MPRARPRHRPAPATRHADRQAVTTRGAGAARLLPFRAMKGIVLAGGTATRLYPLTIVTNKHLLPIYDRPMIYYPIETLAGMGIREVMVIVGGKSVGDVVELLADGSAFGLDLTYRYQPGALGHRPRHRAGPRLRRRRRVLLRPRRQHPARASRWPTSPTSSRTGRTAPGTLLYRVPDPERFGVAELDADGRVVGFEEKPEHPKSDLIPIGVYFLRPRCVRGHRAPAAVGSRRARDHRRPQPLHPRRAGSSARVYEGHWTDAGTVPVAPARRRAGRRRRRRRPARAAGQPAGRLT